MGMEMNTPIVKTASKDVLARLMASENITVEHRSEATTASFDTLNRVLTLPIWQEMDNSLYDMLCGHEVAHALWTPSDEWREQMDRFGAINRAPYQMFVNIVEDARIERMIKAKFPGLRRDFYAGYKNLHQRDLFEIGDKDINELPLIDRLNLHFKIGPFTTIPFAADERQWVDALENTKTFADSCEVAADLFEAHKQEEEKQQQQQQQDGENGIEMPAPGGEDEQDEQDGQGEGSDHLDNDGESENENAGSGSAGDDENQTENGSGSGESQDGSDCGQSMTDDTDDGEGSESTDGENAESGEGSTDEEQDSPDYQNDAVCRGGSTQNAFDRAMENMIDNNSRDRKYYPFPKINIDSIIVDYKDVHKNLSSFIRSGDKESAAALTMAANEMNKFERDSRKTVNMMAQQFIRRQRADEAHRTSTSKTGMLDMDSIISYKWNEDLFLRSEEIADGKNHGLVIFVDWSGSMSDIMEDTIKQMIQMVLFCKKVGIPFEVYSFTSQMTYPEGWNDLSLEERQDHPFSKQAHQFTSKSDEGGDESTSWLHDFQLNNYLSSRMNSRETKAALTHMMYLAMAMNWDNRYNGFRMPSGHDLGCTPLNEAIAAATKIIPQFRADNNLQIVNAMFLTDGESSSRLYDYGNEAWIVDPTTKKSYKATKSTPALLELLRDRTGANTVGIYLSAARSLNNRYSYGYSDEQVASYKKDGFATTDKAGYTEYFIVKANKKVENDFLDNLDDGASYTRIKNAFMKASSTRVNSRVLLGRVIDLIAA